MLFDFFICRNHSFIHSIILSLYHSIIHHSITLSFYHSITLSFYQSIILSLYHQKRGPKPPLYRIKLFALLNNPLLYHCVCNFYKSSDIRTFHIINPSTYITVVHAIFMDINHDAMQSLVNFFPCPGKPEAVL